MNSAQYRYNFTQHIKNHMLIKFPLTIQYFLLQLIEVKLFRRWLLLLLTKTELVVEFLFPVFLLHVRKYG